MRLDQMTIALRVRSPWQAMDLGLRMVRANARAVWVPYVQFTLPIFIVLNALGYLVDHLWIGWFFIWWLKPMYDRIPLHVLSRVTFGTEPTRKETLRSPFKWKFGLLASWLTLRRFSFWRSMTMPIDVLENLSDTRLPQRRSVLVSAVSAQMMGLTFVCMLFEIVIYVSLILLFYMFIPVEYLQQVFDNFQNNLTAETPKWADLALNFVYYVGVVAISPFYVGAGFAAYLNRRTQLEAWDIEIAFKRIASRFKAVSSAIALCCVLASGIGMSHHAIAEETETNTTKAEDIKVDKPKPLQELMGDRYKAQPKSAADAVAKAYQDKDLAPKEKVTKWEPKNKKKEEETQDPSFEGLESIFQAFAVFIAFMAQYGLWILLALFLAFLVWKLRDWMPWQGGITKPKRQLDALSESDVLNLETLPSDVSHVVQQLWPQQPRAALALLYRASVEKLADRLGIHFPPGATEAECLRRSKRLSQPESEAVFQRVVRAWQAAAYAHRLPDQHEFELLLGDWKIRWEKGV
jgi:Domain of unknown function (DUF4129)